MGMQSNIDIVKKIHYIDTLKCSILSETAHLFESMSGGNEPSLDDKKEILAKMVILNYLLAEQIGVEIESLDSSIVSKLKAELLRGERQPANVQRLLQHFLRD